MKQEIDWGAVALTPEAAAGSGAAASAFAADMS
jgi:hypothetical protein